MKLIQKQEHLQQLLTGSENEGFLEEVGEDLIIEEYLEDELDMNNETQEEFFDCIEIPSFKAHQDTSSDSIIRKIDKIQENNQIILDASKLLIKFQQRKTNNEEKTQREDLIYEMNSPKLIMQPSSSGGIILFATEKICEICGQRFTSENRFQKHQLASHPLSDPITCCGHVFDLMSEYKKHQTSVHPILIECKECGKKLKSRKTFLVHKKSHQSVATRRFKCSHHKCHKSFNFKLHLENHERIHTGKKYFNDLNVFS